MSRPDVRGFLHESTNTITYVVADPATKTCAIVDTALDYDAASGRTSTAFADEVIGYVEEQGLNCALILETHIHADHLTAAPYFKEKLGGEIVAGFNLPKVQDTFAALFGVDAADVRSSASFDRFLEDGETFKIGELDARAIWTPGHTPACMSYVVGDAVFTGDALFMPDFGSGRCDFPGGDARALFKSIRKLQELPDDTRVFVGHDYGTGGREIAWETTIGEEKANNKHVRPDASEDDFVKFRVERDAQLPVPKLLLPSVQVNMRGGVFPPPDADGVRRLRIPLDAF